ncbi:MAG: hypothetical protein FWG56_05585 [Desulfovibrionaceae bacterium]|nr:hypothetical protein [Desulfovibrionaceae bacterium]
MTLRAEWGGRVDTLDIQVAMMWEAWRRLAVHGGFLTKPWYSDVERQADAPPLLSVEALRADMVRMTAVMGRTMYMFTQDRSPKRPRLPRATMGAMLSARSGFEGWVANQVFVDMRLPTSGLQPVDDPRMAPRQSSNPNLYSIGFRLVTDFVDIWHPDFVRLGGLVDPQGRISPMGYVSWLSDDVIDSRQLPDAPIKQRYANGTLLGVRLDADDEGGQAEALAAPCTEPG